MLPFFAWKIFSISFFISLDFYLQVLFIHHYSRNRVDYFVVTAAASGRAMRYFLYVLKRFFHVVERFFAVKRALYVGIRHLLTIADNVVFHKYYLKYLSSKPLKPAP